MEIYFEPTFYNINYPEIKPLYDDRWELYNILEPFEFINQYRTILIIKDNVGTVYVNSNCPDTMLMMRELCYDNYSDSQLKELMDGIIKDGKIIKNRYGK